MSNIKEEIYQIINYANELSTGVSEIDLRKKAKKLLDNYIDRVIEDKDKICEWKYIQQKPTGQNLYISCNKSELFVSSVYDYKFCPYCGKKIKEIK